MTATLINVAIQMFEDRFIAKYAAFQTLMGTTQERSGIIGDAYKWPVIGNSTMQDRGAPQSAVPPTPVTHVHVVTTFEDKIVNNETDIFTQSNVNVSEVNQLVKDLSGSVGRQIDQFKINALIASPTTNTIADGGTNLTVNKLREAKFFMDKQNVPPGTRYFAFGASQLEALLRSTEATSADFNSVKALVAGELDTFMGFKFFMFGDRAEGGLPLAGTIRTNFAWHLDSMGYVESLSPHIATEWIHEKQSWSTIARIRAGSSALLNEGIVKIDCEETA